MSRRLQPELTTMPGARPLMLALVVCFSLLATATWAQSATPDAERKGVGERITSYALVPVTDAPPAEQEAVAPSEGTAVTGKEEARPAKLEASKASPTLTTEQRVEQLVAKGVSQEKAEAMVSEEAKTAAKDTHTTTGVEPLTNGTATMEVAPIQE